MKLGSGNRRAALKMTYRAVIKALIIRTKGASQMEWTQNLRQEGGEQSI
jgi:citrate lyase gamma subunit